MGCWVASSLTTAKHSDPYEGSMCMLAGGGSLGNSVSASGLLLSSMPFVGPSRNSPSRVLGGPPPQRGSRAQEEHPEAVSVEPGSGAGHLC